MVLFFSWALSSIVEELTYEKFCNFKNYECEVYYLNGHHEIKVFRLPENIYLQVNCYSHKGNFNDCKLQYSNNGLKLSLGHWQTVLSGVNSFKICSIK